MKKYVMLFMILVPVLGCTGQPEMKGKVNIGDLEGEDWFESGYNAYEPKESVVAELQSRAGDYSLVIFGGAWCPDTRRMLPPIMKVLSEANADPDKVEIWMLDKNFHSGGGPEKNLGIRSVPTFIVYRDQKEVGRIQASEKQTPEAALLNLLPDE